MEEAGNGHDAGQSDGPSRVAGIPRPTRGWGGSHRPETLQLYQSPGPTGGKSRVRTLRQTAGSTDERDQVRLAGPASTLIHPIPITDQNPLPAHDPGRTSTTRVGAKSLWRWPWCPGFPPALRGVVDGGRRRGFVVDESADGGWRYCPGDPENA